MNRTQLHIGVALSFAALVLAVAVFHIDIPIVVAVAAITLLAVSFWHEGHRWLPPRVRNVKPSSRPYRPTALAVRTTER